MKKRLFLLLTVAVALTAQAQQRERVSILGDSYSTYQGYIPTDNEAWYFEPRDSKRTTSGARR